MNHISGHGGRSRSCPSARFFWALALLAVWVAPVLAAGGTVSGKVDAVPVKYLADTVVYLKDVPGEHAPKAVNLDQKGMKFLPRIVTIARGDTVKFMNHDTVKHNVYSPDHETYNLGSFNPGEIRTYTFADSIGVYTQLCSIHPEMLGYIFVGQNPYAAVVDATGHYTLKDVPAGSYTLAVWNPQLKTAERSVTVAEGKSVEANLSLKR
jgi:plastocyanin